MNNFLNFDIQIQHICYQNMKRQGLQLATMINVPCHYVNFCDYNCMFDANNMHVHNLPMYPDISLSGRQLF